MSIWRINLHCSLQLFYTNYGIQDWAYLRGLCPVTLQTDRVQLSDPVTNTLSSSQQPHVTAFSWTCRRYEQVITVKFKYKNVWILKLLTCYIFHFFILIKGVLRIQNYCLTYNIHPPSKCKHMCSCHFVSPRAWLYHLWNKIFQVCNNATKHVNTLYSLLFLTGRLVVAHISFLYLFELIVLSLDTSLNTHLQIIIITVIFNYSELKNKKRFFLNRTVENNHYLLPDSTKGDIFWSKVTKVTGALWESISCWDSVSHDHNLMLLSNEVVHRWPWLVQSTDNTRSEWPVRLASSFACKCNDQVDCFEVRKLVLFCQNNILMCTWVQIANLKIKKWKL